MQLILGNRLVLNAVKTCDVSVDLQLEETLLTSAIHHLSFLTRGLACFLFDCKISSFPLHHFFFLSFKAFVMRA